jgi:hypothetical protein
MEASTPAKSTSTLPQLRQQTKCPYKCYRDGIRKLGDNSETDESNVQELRESLSQACI